VAIDQYVTGIWDEKGRERYLTKIKELLKAVKEGKGKAGKKHFGPTLGSLQEQLGVRLEEEECLEMQRGLLEGCRRISLHGSGSLFARLKEQVQRSFREKNHLSVTYKLINLPFLSEVCSVIRQGLE